VARRTALTTFQTLLLLGVVFAVLLGACTGLGLFGYGVFSREQGEEAKVNAARMQVRELTRIAQTYQVQNGELPPTLAAMAEPGPDGRPSFVEPAALIDPWGRQYGYDPDGGRNDNLRPDVWSEGPRPGDPASVIGNWEARPRGP
jgi:hypothetical protein